MYTIRIVNYCLFKLTWVQYFKVSVNVELNNSVLVFLYFQYKCISSITN